jgi:hypothetical protein
VLVQPLCAGLLEFVALSMSALRTAWPPKAPFPPDLRWPTPLFSVDLPSPPTPPLRLKVDEDGTPLFWNMQQSAPALSHVSRLRYYDGQPSGEGGQGLTLYPHHPNGCRPSCPRLPLAAVRRPSEAVLRVLIMYAPVVS